MRGEEEGRVERGDVWGILFGRAVGVTLFDGIM